MRFNTLVVLISSLATVGARIIGLAVPETIQPGQGGGFNAIIETEDYIQSVYEVAIAFGIAPKDGNEGSIGAVMDTFYLGPEQSNTPGNVTKWTTIPLSTPKGKAVISASLFSLYGAVSSPTLSTFRVSVDVDDSTSTIYKSSSLN